MLPQPARDGAATTVRSRTDLKERTMPDTYAYLIIEPDWDSDTHLAQARRGGTTSEMSDEFAAHKAFQVAVAELGAQIVGGAALQNAKYGAVVRPGSGDDKVAGAVYTDAPYTESAEIVTGFYLVRVDDEDTARRIAALVPTGGVVEMRKVFPTGG